MAPACLLGECSTSGRQLLTAPRAGLLRRAAAGRPGCCRPGHRQLAGSFRAPTTCSVATHELSTYKFPSRKPEVHQWLESCIQDAVKHLDQAPFLQMVYPDRPFKQLERHSVVQAVVSVPQLWRPIAEHLSHAKPEVVVLVHNLPVAAAKANDGEEQAIDFWGVVVQSKLRSSAEGCYVLKTVRSVDPVGCQCTHYSLTRVCRGEPIAAQLSSAWL
ncbi:hypothetical protein WJX72_002450 [[Myrmecia] bisecta]|uniref:DUF7804 domain-containing protein n=1 Tax=[Myrmecia] bisecta TaxID=41462 RepID=A0AAW1QEL0_9CHLO